MRRDDLLALDDDALAALATLGATRRARREEEAGRGPRLAVAADGVVEAIFEEGTRTRLLAGASLDEARCDCVARQPCRHALALAIAYRARHGAQDAPDEAAARWRPADIDAVAFEARLPRSQRAALARLRARRQVVTLRHDSPPTAVSPFARVRFLVPGDVDYALCDCVARGRCAHVAYALEAFACADPDAASVTPPVRGAGAAQDAEQAGTLYETCAALVESLLREGVEAGPGAHAGALAQARLRAEIADATWLRLALDELEAQIAAYTARDALFDEDRLLELTLEILARPRAALAAREDAVFTALGGDPLGRDELWSVDLAKLRLSPMGARVTSLGDWRIACAAWFDGAGGFVTMRREIAPDAEGPAPLARIARTPIGARLTFGGAAGARLTGLRGARGADGALSLVGGGVGRPTLAGPCAGAIDHPAALLRDVDAYKQALRRSPPPWLAPRGAPHFVVADVAGVEALAYAPGAQTLHARLSVAGPAGETQTLIVTRGFDPASPGALDALAAALAAGPTQIRGEARLANEALVIDPWSVRLADRLVVPDLSEAVPSALSAAPAAPSLSPNGALADAHRHLVARLTRGARASPSANEALATLSQDGFTATMGRLDALRRRPCDAGAFLDVAALLARLDARGL